MTRIWLVNWHFQSRITLWCRHKSTNVSMGLCWQMQVYCMTSMIYLFRPYLPLKQSIEKRRKQSCTPNIWVFIISILAQSGNSTAKANGKMNDCDKMNELFDCRARTTNGSNSVTITIGNKCCSSMPTWRASYGIWQGRRVVVHVSRAFSIGYYVQYAYDDTLSYDFRRMKTIYCDSRDNSTIWRIVWKSSYPPT